MAALGSRVLHVHVSTGKVLRTTDEGLNKVGCSPRGDLSGILVVAPRSFLNPVLTR